MERGVIEEEEIDQEEIEDEFYEIMKCLLMAIQAIITVLREIVITMHEGIEPTMAQRIERPLKRRPVTRKGYNYIHQILEANPEDFRELHRMPPNVFLKLCTIVREQTPIEDTRYICVEEMLATFLLIVGHNDRYCNVRQRFGRSHFATSQNFNKILKALNTIAPQMMVKPESTVPFKIRESTRFYPYFKVFFCLYGLQKF